MSELTSKRAIDYTDGQPARARPPRDAAERSRLHNYLAGLDDRFAGVGEARAVREQAEQAARSVIGALTKQRVRRGVSQAMVAGAMQTSQSAVSRLESGSIDIGLETLFRYALAIGLDPGDVFALDATYGVAEEVAERS